jgi:hypothetical protein
MAGYPQVIRLMSHHEEFAMFRKFSYLSLQNLIYMQAELMHLEDTYDLLSAKDYADPSRSHRSRDWWSLTQPDDDGSCELWETVLEIRSKLATYREPMYLLRVYPANFLPIQMINSTSISFYPTSRNRIRTISNSFAIGWRVPTWATSPYEDWTVRHGAKTTSRIF